MITRSVLRGLSIVRVRILFFLQKPKYSKSEAMTGIRRFLNILLVALAETVMLSAMKPSGSKLLYVVRHGQALHNPRAEVARAAGCSMEEFVEWMRKDDALDAELTELGRSQARSVNLPKKDADSIELVVSSPLSRAIETAELVLPPTTKIDPAATTEQRICYEDFREVNGDLLNCKRRERRELVDRWPHWNFNEISETDELWTPTMEAFEDAAERGYKGLCWLMERPEKSIFLVAHGGLLKLMMNTHPHVSLRDGRSNNSNRNGDTNIKPVESRFDNCELRRYELCWGDNDKNIGDYTTNGQLPISLVQID